MRARKSPKDAEWLDCVLADTDTLLADHAHCEKKAAATALSLISRYPDRTSLVTAMAALAVEELGHFAEVHGHIVARGRSLGPDEGDPYAKALVAEVRGGPTERLVDRLLVSALIEARSCQRLVLLGKNHPDPVLAEMFRRFAAAEAGHGHQFVSLARDIAGAEGAARLEARLEELSELEAELVDRSAVRCAMH